MWMKTCSVKVVFIAIICLCFVVKLVSSKTLLPNEEENSFMLSVLDETDLMMTGKTTGIDRTFFSKLRGCFDEFDSRLKGAQDKAWEGLVEFWKLRNDPDGEPWGHWKVFLEKNVTKSPVYGMEIQEPCNYASNLVYYHKAVEICDRRINGKAFNLSKKYVDALGKAAAALGFSSSFFHGSDTILGSFQDIGAISMFVYPLYEALLENLNFSSPILHDLNSTARSLRALDLVDAHMEMHRTVPVKNWSRFLESMDIPSVEMVFAGMITTLFILIDPKLVDNTAPFLLDAFHATEEQKDFVKNEFVPELKRSAANVSLSFREKARLVSNFSGFMIKIMSAFFWQETYFANDLTPKPFVNMMGVFKMPLVNRIARLFHGFEYHNENLMSHTNLYSGEVRCNKLIPHAKWHVGSATGMLDLAYVVDDLIGRPKSFL